MQLFAGLLKATWVQLPRYIKLTHLVVWHDYFYPDFPTQLDDLADIPRSSHATRVGISATESHNHTTADRS